MGGVADYSGSLVLEAPLARATVCAAQPSDDGRLSLWSEAVAEEGLLPRWEADLATVLTGAGESYADVRRRLTVDPRSSWVAYAAGVITVLHAEGRLPQPRGMRLHLRSDVPLGGGVSSSASVEVAAMAAVCGALGVAIDGLELARLCQRVENLVVGAPCGIMDQVTCALGEAGRLIAIRCRPCEVVGQLALPQEAALFGIHSGVKHSVGGSRYTRARVAAFMGLKLIRSMDPDSGLELLCDLEPPMLRRRYYSHLPARLSGRQFLEQFGETDDPVTRVHPNESYPVRGAVEHAVYENHRVEQFMRLLAGGRAGPRVLSTAGRLMYASHWSYGQRIGLGARETDLLVRLARQAGPEAGIYGAKITGGGSGGTVALLTSPAAGPVVERIAADYAGQTGLSPEVLEGTSPGAVAYGLQTLVV
jgi:galactokinase